MSAIKNVQIVARDPLAEVDEAIDAHEVVAELAFAETEAQTNREHFLRDCVSAAEVVSLTGRSQQSIERMRKTGLLLALRTENGWRYPRWQFDADVPGGVLPGLADTLRYLHLSSEGAAFWLFQPSESLGGSPPIEFLRRQSPEQVIQLAREYSFTP
ncbi:MAG TPA: hypothetical protein VF789_07135 [Thermoanaerobaculia bacterium]